MKDTAEFQPTRQYGQRRFISRRGAVFVVLVVFPILAYLHSQARYTVIGPTDPVTGIGIEYTVSPRYTRERDLDSNSTRRDNGAFADWRYKPSWSWPSPFMLWLRENVVRPLNMTISEPQNSSTITQTSSKHSKLSGCVVDPEGFVRAEPKRDPAKCRGKISALETKMVANCPTTLMTVNSDFTLSGRWVQCYTLFVHPSDQSVTYVFDVMGEEGRSPELDLGELRAIRDSIRIVKAH